jgi:hypothetical protein
MPFIERIIAIHGFCYNKYISLQAKSWQPNLISLTKTTVDITCARTAHESLANLSSPGLSQK